MTFRKRSEERGGSGPRTWKGKKPDKSQVVRLHSHHDGKSLCATSQGLVEGMGKVWGEERKESQKQHFWRCTMTESRCSLSPLEQSYSDCGFRVSLKGRRQKLRGLFSQWNGVELQQEWRGVFSLRPYRRGESGQSLLNRFDLSAFVFRREII